MTKVGTVARLARVSYFILIHLLTYLNQITRQVGLGDSKTGPKSHHYTSNRTRM